MILKKLAYQFVLKKEKLKSEVKEKNGITLIALVITMIVPYDKMKECCNM